MSVAGAVIAGAAEAPYTRHPAEDETTTRLLETAIRGALENAGLDRDAVDGLGVCSFSLAPDHAIDLAWQLGLSPSWIMEDTLGGASGVNMLTHAIRAIAAGDAETIVLVAGGRSSAASFARIVDAYNLATLHHLAPIPYGGPNTLFAMLTQRHMASTGLERADYGQVSIAQRAWASLNPGAVYRTPLTIEEYLAAPIVAAPLSIYDCVPIVSGADAIVVTAHDRITGTPAVEVAAIGSRHNADRGTGDGLRTGLAQLAPRLWLDAGIGPGEVDLACIYDDYPVMVLIQLADLGLVPGQDLARFLHSRLAEERWPLNTSGGMLSAGQATGNGGMHGIVEAVRQLRWEAGDRQVAGARTAVVTGYGMVTYRYGACAAAAILARRDP